MAGRCGNTRVKSVCWGLRSVGAAASITLAGYTVRWNNLGNPGIVDGRWWWVLGAGATLDSAWSCIFVHLTGLEDHGPWLGREDGSCIIPLVLLELGSPLFLFLFRDGHAGQRVHG